MHHLLLIRLNSDLKVMLVGKTNFLDLYGLTDTETHSNNDDTAYTNASVLSDDHVCIVVKWGMICGAICL